MDFTLQLNIYVVLIAVNNLVWLIIFKLIQKLISQNNPLNESWAYRK